MATAVGSEILVNTTTLRQQYDPTVATFADGRFVVAWADDSASGGDTSTAGIRARIFNADGTTSTSDFLVNTTTFDAQELPTITALPDGHFVVAWRDYSQTGGDRSSTAVRGQVFNPDGSKSGGEFLG